MGTYTNQQVESQQPIADRRRKVESEQGELILSRAACLPARERELLKALYGDGLTSAEVARLTGLSTFVVQRRARRLIERLFSDRFVFVLRHRDRWPPTRRRIATALVLHGRTTREAAAELRISRTHVRAHWHIVRVLFEQTQSATSAA